MADINKNRAILYGIGALCLLFLIVRTATGGMDSPLGSGEQFGMWLAAFLSLCVLSFLYDDNPFYKFAEHLFVGVSAAYYMAQAAWESIVKTLMVEVAPELLTGLLAGAAELDPSIGKRIWYCLPLVLGVMLLFRLSKQHGWVARWPLAFIVGWSAGTNLIRYLKSDFMSQIQPTFISVVATDVSWSFSLGTVLAILAPIVVVFGLLAALIYFFFSVEHKGAFGVTSTIGIWILMITFGAAFSYTVMGRIALLVGRMEFLFKDWLQLIA